MLIEACKSNSTEVGLVVFWGNPNSDYGSFMMYKYRKARETEDFQ
jgi:hypothetical protein